MSQDPETTGLEPNVIVTKSGDPYKTQQAAMLALRAKANRNENPLIPEEWEVAKIDEDEFVITRKTVASGAETSPATSATPASTADPIPTLVVSDTPEVEPEKYWLLKFNDRFSKNETQDVPLSVNGETLVFHRGKEVVVPGRFRECADNTRHPIYEHWNNSLVDEAQSGRKNIGTQTTYPYTVIREATEEEFRAMKAIGDKELASLKEQQG